MGNRIDTPLEIEREIESFDCPQREEATRNAFAFLHYGGRHPRTRLSTGYSARTPPGKTNQELRYTGTPTVEGSTEDGRTVFEGEEGSRRSIKYALERLSLSEDERNVVRAAFGLLLWEEELCESEI